MTPGSPETPEPLAVPVPRANLARPSPVRLSLRSFLPLLLLGFTLPARAGEPAAPELAAVTTPNPRAATPEELALINDVLVKVADDYRRWAYTEHRTLRDEKGRTKSDLILRFDPSKPYAEQWTPLSVNGKEPTERDRKKYREMGERQAPPEFARPVSPDPKNRRRLSLGEVLDVPRSSIASETATHLTFDLALLKFGNERFPPEKFQVLARIRKEGALLENISVRLRESFRSKLILKVKSGEGTLDFAPVDPKHPPALIALSGDASASVLFINVGGTLLVTRSELRHVKPFDERFDVQIGTLKAIDF